MCLITTGCENAVLGEDEEGKIDRLKGGSSCETLQAPTIDNQLIIRFNDQLLDKEIKVILSKLRDHPVKPKVFTCDCSNIRLALVEFPPGITPEDRVRIASDELGNEGNGELFDNIQISLPSFPGTFTQGAFQTNPTPANAVVVAVIDGGIHKSNPAFFNYLWQNPRNGTDPCSTLDDNGFDFTSKYGNNGQTLHPHASVVSGVMINSLPSYVNLRLMDLRIFDKNGKGSLYDALCAIQFAIDNEADIINMSWGYYHKDIHPLMTEYMQKIYDHHIVAVTSAGNEGINTDECLHHPSYFNSVHKNTIAVAALDTTERALAPYSNYGMNTVGIAARGTHSVLIETTRFSIDGTSYAAPEVTKAAATLMTLSPGRDFLEVTDYIFDSAIPLGIPVQTRGKLREIVTAP